MKALHLKAGLILPAALFAAGCATTVPVASHSLRCDISAELLASKCEKPKQLADTATYESVVDTMRNDRQALLECSAKLDLLRDSIARCNQESEEFNKKIDDVNSGNNN